MKKTQRFLAFFLATVMVFSCLATLPFGAWAADQDEEETPDVVEEATYVYNYQKYMTGVAGNFDATSGMLVSDDTASGYVTFTSTGGDQFATFATAPDKAASELGYVVIKYRATATASAQLYVKRSIYSDG